MNTFAESTALPLFIWFKVDLSRKEASAANGATELFVADSPRVHNALAFALANKSADESGGKAYNSKVGTETISALAAKLRDGFALILAQQIAAEVSEKGIQCKDLLSTENQFDRGSEWFPLVICRDLQMVGFFRVTDWRAGIEVAKNQLQRFGFLNFSKIGWRDPHEVLLRLVYPKEEQWAWLPCLEKLKSWVDGKSKEYGLPTTPPK